MGYNGRREEGRERGDCILGYLIAFVGLRRRWVWGISSIHCSCFRRLQWGFSYVSLYHVSGKWDSRSPSFFALRELVSV
jgi:hypothetical protein